MLLDIPCLQVRINRIDMVRDGSLLSSVKPAARLQQFRSNTARFCHPFFCRL